MRLPLAAALLGIAALLGGTPALALDASFSGFATLGLARTDSAYTYQRFMDEDASLERDTLLAGQLDLRLAPAWSATLQLRLAPHTHDDSAWQPQATWAFVAWRPDNDWLLRGGRMRVPLYLYSEALEVGLAHDMARLPYEMYSIVPTNEFDGLFASRSLSLGARELSVDGYGGQIDTWARSWLRDGVPGQQPAGAQFRQIHVTLWGLVLTARDPLLTWRLGYHSTRTHQTNDQPLPVRFPRVDIAPGVGYWQVDAALPGPGVPTVHSIRNQILTAGLEWQLGEGWRIAAEAVRMKQQDTELGSDSRSGYVALFKQLGDFTPYASWASQRSSRTLREWLQRLRSAPLPAGLPGAEQINAANRVAAESLYAFDQQSLALGLSWALSPKAKLKAEWMRTRVGSGSTHFDTPPGRPDAQNLRVDTLSANVSVAF